MWEPLPLIVYGYAIHPLTPSRRETRLAPRNRLSSLTEVSGDDHSVILKDVLSLEVGDEVYAFEKYTPSPKDNVEGPWYRGCVVFLCCLFFMLNLPVSAQLCCLYYAAPSHLLVRIFFIDKIRQVRRATSLHWNISCISYLRSRRAPRC
jgi:hypothetical protein